MTGLSPPGRILQRDVIRLVLHLPFGHRDLASPVSQALRLYLRSANLGTDFFSEYCLGDEPVALDAEDWADIWDTLSPPPSEAFLDEGTDEAFLRQKMKEQFDRTVELSVSSSGVTGYGFFYWARLPWRQPVKNQVSLVSFSWPIEYLDAHGPERMRAEIMQLAALLPYASGHAGLAFSSPNVWGPPMKGLHEKALRHPGLDVTHGQRELGSRVDGVHWLNLLGTDVVTQIGGEEALRARLHSPSTSVHPLEKGRVLVMLGERPEAGDLLQGDTLPAYRELARVLEPWLFPCPENETWRDTPPATACRWWRRFLD
ncbi:MAG: type VI immunity family protein [Cystobacter sp.]